jgi:hypothetical protein
MVTNIRDRSASACGERDEKGVPKLGEGKLIGQTVQRTCYPQMERALGDQAETNTSRNQLVGGTAGIYILMGLSGTPKIEQEVRCER